MLSKSVLVLAGLVFSCCVQAQSQRPNACVVQWGNLQAAGTQIERIMKTAASESQSIGDQTNSQHNACLGGPVRWEEIHWALDLPEVTMKDMAFSFDLPEFAMREREFSWDNPTTICTTRCDGPTIPVVVCSGLNCRVENRPSCYPSCRIENRRERVVISVPETRMVRKEIVMGIPEIAMKRTDMRFNSVSFYPESGCIGDCEKKCRPVAEEGQRRQRERIDAAKQTSNALYSSAYASAANCTVDYLETQRSLVAAQFDAGIASLKKSIQDNGSRTEIVSALSAQLGELEKKKAEAMAKLDQAIAQLKSGASTARF